ncbi:hypothetical protein DICVIV_03071 [Dictyocaulus viviparus]|uniref:UDENN FLCN/SMCR8-type domain-containing protein n=1 Tax=Dictyocaulus viviparus TaxID=29172 RepID=A0A0D8Y219_DICVI|nr:hypothetical protein DICVIV_03071 [Dictyocaulus viviparus]
MSHSSVKAEDLLLRSRRIIDPFNRMGCNIDPTLTVIEFCQFQGPRPLANVSLKPNNTFSSLDFDSLSLWLMSSEITCGTVLNLYNQQMGIYALSYYTIMYDISARAFQARKIRSKTQAISDKLSDSRSYMECNGHKREDRIVAEESFTHVTQTSVLSPISKLAPCAYNTFITGLNHFLAECTTENEVCEGVLYSVNTPILRFPKRSCPMQITTFNSGENGSVSKEETLRMVSQHLDNLLLPVLTGEDMIVCGSEQRKGTVIDFVEKINLLKPKSHPNHNVVTWAKNESRPKGVIGICRNRSETAALNLPGIAILDTNTSVLHTVPYRGVLLTNLRRKRRFPSDAALLAFVVAALTNISSLVYISRFLSPLHLESEKISLDDQRILLNLLTELDFIKYQEQKSALEKARSKSILLKAIKL